MTHLLNAIAIAVPIAYSWLVRRERERSLRRMAALRNLARPL